MKTRIYWFSGTGNSLAVAKALAAQCGGAELIPVSSALRNPPPAAERTGFVFPVYGFAPPAPVARLIEKLHADPGGYVFAVATCAGASGGALTQLRRMLWCRGLNLHAGWSVRMPENFPPFGGAPSPARQQRLHRSAAEKTARIAEELRTSPCGVLEESGWFWRIAGFPGRPLFRRFLRSSDRFFRVDGTCNGCGTCASICPVGNIEMKEGRPVWLGRCEQCYACFHWCPQQAVQYGFSAKQRRYHHPEIRLSDLMQLPE